MQNITTKRFHYTFTGLTKIKIENTREENVYNRSSHILLMGEKKIVWLFLKTLWQYLVRSKLHPIM